MLRKTKRQVIWMHPLRAYRKARKLTIDDVVTATKLSKATVSRIASTFPRLRFHELRAESNPIPKTRLRL